MSEPALLRRVWSNRQLRARLDADEANSGGSGSPQGTPLASDAAINNTVLFGPVGANAEIINGFGITLIGAFGTDSVSISGLGASCQVFDAAGNEASWSFGNNFWGDTNPLPPLTVEVPTYTFALTDAYYYQSIGAAQYSAIDDGGFALKTSDAGVFSGLVMMGELGGRSGARHSLDQSATHQRYIYAFCGGDGPTPDVDMMFPIFDLTWPHGS